MKAAFPIILFILLGVTHKIVGQVFSIRGVVLDSITNKPIKGAFVRKHGSDGSDEMLKTDSVGNYFFDSTKIKSNTSYTLSAGAPNLMYFNSLNKYLSTQSHNIAFVVNFKLLYSDDRYCPAWPFAMFEFKKAELTETIIDSALNEWLILLNDNPGVVIELDGFASKGEGTKSEQLTLSINRANACRNYLLAKKIDSNRILFKGLGISKKNQRYVIARILRFDYKGQK